MYCHSDVNCRYIENKLKHKHMHKRFVFDARVLLLEYYKMNEFLITDFTYFSN